MFRFVLICVYDIVVCISIEDDCGILLSFCWWWCVWFWSFFLVFFISENLMLVDWSLIMICFGDCFCLCGLLMWWEVMILEDVSVIFMDDVIFRSFFVVDFLGVLGILEIWMSDCCLYCFSLFNCRCRFFVFLV